MVKYRTFWERFGAGVIDGLGFVPLGFLNVYFLSAKQGKPIIIAWILVSYSAWCIYSVVMHSRFGQTLGKMATGVKVLDISEQRVPTLKQAVLRDIGYIALNEFVALSLIYLVLTHDQPFAAFEHSFPQLISDYAGLAWFTLELTTMLTNTKRRALHDFIGGTVVVRTDQRAETAVHD